MTKPIDVVELRKQIKEGIFNVCLYKEKIYIKNTKNGVSIMLYDLKEGGQE